MGAAAEPRTSPGPASRCRRREKDSNPEHSFTRACSCWVFTQTQVGPGHSHARPSRGNTLSSESRGRERNGKQAFFLLFFVSVWERLQARSLENPLGRSRAKTNSPHDKQVKQMTTSGVCPRHEQTLNGPLVPVFPRINNTRGLPSAAEQSGLPLSPTLPGRSGLLSPGRREDPPRCRRRWRRRTKEKNPATGSGGARHPCPGRAGSPEGDTK